jgi:cytidine deaminase
MTSKNRQDARVKNRKSPDLGRIGDLLAPLTDVELFFGLVGPTGANLDLVCREMATQLSLHGYEMEIISLSKLISGYFDQPDRAETESEYERIDRLMTLGTRLRTETQSPSIVAALSIAAIRDRRQSVSGDPNKPRKKAAYVLRSLKRAEEVELFRSIYGKAFNLISAYSAVSERVDVLARKIASSEKVSADYAKPRALQLINRDADEEGMVFGQKVRDTFPLADYFVTVSDAAILQTQIERLIRLAFGYPHVTPTKDEHAMFIAQATAYRSADLSRQVGASIVTNAGEILSTGCNDVPKAGGGLYWVDDASPKRDVELGHDSNTRIKREIVEELISRLRDGRWLKSGLAKKSNKELYEDSISRQKGVLKGTQVLDVIEFGRAVHAEMDAITQAARLGIKMQGARLFCTTFPCHLCARHIVASGIVEVVYIEPYPKSRTEELYPDSIDVQGESTSLVRGHDHVQMTGRVLFRPFVGVSPRRYMDFFEMIPDSRKDSRGDAVQPKPSEKNPRVKRFVLSYLDMETSILSRLS